MNLRRISTLWTPFYKFGLPAIFAIGFVNTFILWGWPSADSVRYGRQDGFMYFIPLLFLAFTLWLGWGLKKVCIDEHNRRLYVSNYLKEISIPFSEIAGVSEFILAEPRLVTIRLHNPTEFGQKTVFLGTYRFGDLFAGSQPIVNELIKCQNQ